MATVMSDSRSKTPRAGDTPAPYDPTTFRATTFFDAAARFRTGEEDPRRYLERCLEVIAAREPVVLSARAMKVLERGRAMSVEDYRQHLLERDEARQRLAAIAPLGDALISLSSPGPAPIHDDNSPRPTGNAIFNYASSSLGAPAVTVPLIAVSGMPVGVQIMGQPHADARVAGIARWLAASVAPVKMD